MLQRGVPGHLLHPALVGMHGDPGEGDSPTIQVDEKQHVVRHQASPGKYFNREEVRPKQDVHVPADEFLPSGGLAPLGGGGNSVPTQNVADGLVGQRMAQVDQRSHNPVVSPTGILARQAKHQILELRVDAWSSHRPAWFRTVELVCDEPAVPSQQGIWFSDTGDFLKRVPPQTLADLGQAGPLAISQAESRPEVRFQNAVLRRQIFVLQKEFDSPGR